MSELDLLYTEIEDDLRSSVADLLNSRRDDAALIAMYDGDRSPVDPLWKSLSTDLGLAGLLVPEERGGHGASAREAAVVLEELGRTVAPVPFLTSAVVATTLLWQPSRIYSVRWRRGNVLLLCSSPGPRPQMPLSPRCGSRAIRSAASVPAWPVR